MIVHLARHEGGTVVVERIDTPVVFDGGQPVERVFVEFPLDGRQVTARIVKVLPHDPEGEPIIEAELVDRSALDAESENTLAHLPPRQDDFCADF